MFGVAIFICTQAQTQGFAQHFINSTLGSNGALVLRSRFQPLGTGLPVPPKDSAPGKATHRRYLEGITNAREIMRVSRQFSNVAACSPVLRGTLSARAGFENATVDLFGIDATLHLQTTDLKSEFIAGKFEDFRDNATAVIVGSRQDSTTPEGLDRAVTPTITDHEDRDEFVGIKHAYRPTPIFARLPASGMADSLSVEHTSRSRCSP